MASGRFLEEVEHCMGEGVSQPTDPKQTPNALEKEPGRQEPCDNVRLREGKNPDRRLRVPKYGLSGEGKDVNLLRQLGGWLRSSHSLKECVTAHQSSGSAPIIHGTQARRRSFGLWRSADRCSGRGAFHAGRSHAGRRGGLHGSDDAGTSSDNEGEKPSRRKPKGS